MLARVMTELFFAGIQTEVFTFCWAFLYLVHYPHVQERLRKEIHDQVPPPLSSLTLHFQVGLNGEIAWERRSELPYLEAVVHEVRCLVSLAFLGRATSFRASL